MFLIWLAFIAASVPPFKMSCSQLQKMASRKPEICQRMFGLAVPRRGFKLTQLASGNEDGLHFARAHSLPDLYAVATSVKGWLMT